MGMGILRTGMARTTVDTTRSDTFVVGLIAGVTGVAMIVYATMYVGPAWRYAHAEPRYAEVSRGKIGTQVELDALTQALRASPWRTDLGRAAIVQMLAAQQIGLASLRAVTRLDASRRDLRLGLASSPSDGYAWTRLAIVELRLAHKRAAGAALSAALQVAPAERKLTSVQFDLAAALWPELDKKGRDALAVRLDWAAKWPDLKPAIEGNSAGALRRYIAAERARTQD
jgi:hypothetical protein